MEKALVRVEHSRSKISTVAQSLAKDLYEIWMIVSITEFVMAAFMLCLVCAFSVPELISVLFTILMLSGAAPATHLLLKAGQSVQRSEPVPRELL